jgi:hypothetical protein
MYNILLENILIDLYCDRPLTSSEEVHLQWIATSFFFIAGASSDKKKENLATLLLFTFITIGSIYI